MSDIEILMNGHMEELSIEPQKKSVVSPLNENPYLSDPNMGLELCSSLISKADGFSDVHLLQADIKSVIEHDFLIHTDKDDNTTGAKAYAQLLSWLEQLSEAVSFPQLQQSYTVAVGGSFSAGKTRFLNTVLGCPSLLPTDTTPTTSIPTFLFKGTQDSIDALNFYGKKTAINEEALKAICHAFNTKYNVTFSHILQLIAVERAEFKYPNLIFLDTPGYSKTDNIANSEQNTDENIARAHLRTADYLIWLVDNQNGTVPQPDIEFLKSLELQQPVLVVMSKADKKPESEINKIIKVAKTDLDNAEIDYLDVIGYSAETDIEISKNRSTLTNFLCKINEGSEGSTLQWQLNKIFNDYINHYDSKQQSLKLTYAAFNELIFDEEISSNNKKQLTAIHKRTKTQIDSLFNQKKETESILAELNSLLADICKRINVNLSNRPSAIQFNSIRKKQSVSNKAELCTFDAIMQGDLSVLSNQANLNELVGRVVKISALGVTVSLDLAKGIEILVMKSVIMKNTQIVAYSDIYIDQMASIQIINNKKATVTINF